MSSFRSAQARGRLEAHEYEHEPPPESGERDDRRRDFSSGSASSVQPGQPGSPQTAESDDRRLFSQPTPFPPSHRMPPAPGSLSLRVIKEPPTQVRQKVFEGPVAVQVGFDPRFGAPRPELLYVECSLFVSGRVGNSETARYVAAPTEFADYLQGTQQKLSPQFAASFPDLRMYRRGSELTTVRLQRSSFVRYTELPVARATGS